MAQQRSLERAKLFFFRHFERIFVLLLVLAMVAIHDLVDQKFAFLSFYYLPMILAGFYGGRRFAVMAGVFVVALVLFYQYVQGLDMLPGFYADALFALMPWAGFLILTGYVVGGLAEQREARLAEVKNAYLATLERLGGLLSRVEHVVPGHGPILDAERAREIIEEDLAYLLSVGERGGHAELPAGRRGPAQRRLHERNVAAVAQSLE